MEVSCAVRHIYMSLGAKGLIQNFIRFQLIAVKAKWLLSFP